MRAFGGRVLGHEVALEKIHADHHAGDVFPHRTHRVHVLWLDRENAFGGNEAVRGLETDDAAARCRHADRAGGVGAESNVRGAGRDGHRGAAGGSARDASPPNAERIARRPIEFVDAGRRNRELTEIRLSDDLHLALSSDGKARSVFHRGLARFGEIVRAGSRDDAADVDVVFHRETERLATRLVTQRRDEDFVGRKSRVQLGADGAAGE
jgi:hypothetical protein